jgi:Zn-dependent peptidase ImmA (M78 family)/transcriptional regulator with XRE-family HTH domain
MSRVTHVPVTPSVLDWAIKESGYEPDQLASASGVSTADIQEWLSGKSLPNLTQARKLANKLHRSLAALLLPNPPQSQRLAVEFRHSLTDRQELNPNERRYLRRARRFQETLSWLSRELELQRPTIPSASLITAKPGSVASSARSLLGISTKDQKTWTSPSSAFDQWRSALERMGIVVFLFPLGKSSCTGFSLWDDLAPIVAVNTAWNESARIFTLFHEMAHLVTRTSSACLGFRSSGRTDEVERWCESFSAQLLMPTAEVLATLREFGWHPGKQISDLAVARRIAATYKVSLRAATIRLIDLEAANWSLYKQIPPISDDKPKGGGGSGRDRTQIREDQLGERTTSVFIRAVQRDVLERFQAVEMLDIPDSKFDQLAAASTRVQ